MSGEGDSRLGDVARWLSRVLGAALVLWAISDDPLIGGRPGFGLAQGVVAAIGVFVVASSFASAGWNARILALVLSSAFVLSFGEIAVRVLYSARYQRPYHLDEALLYRLTPGAVHDFQHEATNGGERIRYRVNSDGFRGEELEADPRLRVAVFGDSFVQGAFSALEDTFAERLEDELSARLGDGVEVVNAGVAGYGPGQTLRKMEGDVALLDPDLILIAIFAGNDFGDTIRNKLYRLDDAGRLLETDFTIGPEQRRGFTLRRRELILKRVVRDAVRALLPRLGVGGDETDAMVAMTPRERMDRFLEDRAREFDEYIVRGDHVVHALAEDTYDADVSLTPDSASARYKVRLMDEVLGRMQSIAAERGVPIVLIPIPHPIDVGGHPTGEVDRDRYPYYRPRALVGILERIADRRGMPFVELFEGYRALGSEEVYFGGFDDHWNDRGQRLAAEWVADFLMERELVSAARADADAVAERP
ncbi:MAG: SGNH/GDSL hydrolase family protein [bacterium]|nr:SGNH/GDSL hydrolase family protein [bacterium]